MIHVEKIVDVVKFRLARSFFGKGHYFTACYWVDGLMIDTGCAYTVKELVSALGNRHIDLIVNTHSHEDHIAANNILQAKYHAKLLAHPLAIPVLKAPKVRQPLHPYQKILWGYPKPSKPSKIGSTIKTKKYRFNVIHTPGHTPDHICLYEPREGWIFSGDAYVGGRDRSLRSDYNIWQIIESLKKIAALELDVLFPGSGNIRIKPKSEIEKKIEYLEEMGEKILHLHNNGLGMKEIRKALFGMEQPIAYFTLGHFTGKNLVRSYIEDYTSV